MLKLAKIIDFAKKVTKLFKNSKYIFADFGKCGVNNSPPNQIAINYEAGNWPWMGSLGYWSEEEWIHQCGTTLISNTHFMTAAHCVKLLNSR